MLGLDLALFGGPLDQVRLVDLVAADERRFDAVGEDLTSLDALGFDVGGRLRDCCQQKLEAQKVDDLLLDNMLRQDDAGRNITIDGKVLGPRKGDGVVLASDLDLDVCLVQRTLMFRVDDVNRGGVLEGADGGAD